MKNTNNNIDQVLHNQRAEVMRTLETFSDAGFLSFMSLLCANSTAKHKEEIQKELDEYVSTLHPDHTVWALSFIKHFRDKLAGKDGAGY